MHPPLGDTSHPARTVIWPCWGTGPRAVTLALAYFHQVIVLLALGEWNPDSRRGALGKQAQKQALF